MKGTLASAQCEDRFYLEGRVKFPTRDYFSFWYLRNNRVTVVFCAVTRYPHILLSRHLSWTILDFTKILYPLTLQLGIQTVQIRSKYCVNNKKGFCLSGCSYLVLLSDKISCFRQIIQIHYNV